VSYTIPPATVPTSAPPLIKPYQEALDFQKTRTPLLRGDYYARAMDAARPRAFTITGIEKFDSLLEAHRLGETAIAANMTMSDYADELGALVDAHGGTVLPPERLELIHHNTMVNNNAAGAWRHMTDPELVGDRPFFQYQGPSDGRSSRICKPIHMLIVRHTDPLLKHMWHPNHHWERHEWISLAAGDVNESDVYVSPEGHEYPVINGHVVRPADGWDYNAAEVFAADDSAFVRAAQELRLTDAPAKTREHYNLGALLESAEGLPAVPAIPKAIRELGDDAAQFEAIFGFAEDARRAIVLDYAKDGVWVTSDTRAALAAAAGKASLADAAALAAATVQEPAEVWFVPATTASGETTFIKRYVGVFAAGKKTRKPVAFYLDRSPDGWAMGGGRLGKEEELERLRRGLLTYSRSGRKG
jgi:hypothetical protein